MGEKLMKKKRSQFFGLVLCGGKSTRMGEEKALLEYEDMPLVEHMMRILRKIRTPGPVRDIFLSGTLEEYPCFPDLIPDRGPLGGVYSVLESLIVKDRIDETESYLIILPVDMPRLTASLVEELLSMISNNLLVVHYRGQELPFVLRITKQVRDVLYQMLCVDQDPALCGVHHFFEKLEATNQESVLDYINPEISADVFMNVNTPEDLTRLIEMSRLSDEKKKNEKSEADESTIVTR